MAENDDWEKLETDFWKPEEEDEKLVGVVVGTQETNYGDAFQIDTEEGMWLVNYTTLNPLLEGRIGKEVKIVYKGEKESTKRTGVEYKDFDVYTKN